MEEILVVASKIKALIKKKCGMNTSSSVMEALTRKVEAEIDQAIERARASGRKTIMDRDFDE